MIPDWKMFLYFKKGNGRNSYVGITKTFEVNIL